MEGLSVIIEYNLKTDSYTFDSNIKPEKINDLVSEFLRTQIGKGEDFSKAEERDVYKIKLSIDLSQDIFYCEHNCGNLGLRDGILMGFLKR